MDRALGRESTRRQRHEKRRWRVAAIVGVLCLAACSESAPRAASPPNVLLITIDTLRADRLSIYNEKARPTPHIDALGQAGVVFDAAHCDVTWTVPSMASSLTGTYSSRHGIRNSFHRLSPQSTTLAQRLGARGYATRAVIGSFPLDARYGLDRGFDLYDDDLPPRLSLMDTSSATRTDDEVTALGIGHLRELISATPFFLWLHYLGPHSLNDPALDAAQNLRNHVRQYPRKVVATDSAVGELLDALADLGLAEDTLVVLHSDHGESLGERKWIGHGRYLYENVLRVPLIVRWPGVFPRGERVEHLVGNIDIAPTVLQAVGEVVAESEFDGRSLFPAIFEKAPVRDELYIETLLPGHHMFAEPVARSDGPKTRVGVMRTGVLRPPLKYIRTEVRPLFSGESPDLSEEERAAIDREELYRLPRELPEEDLAGESEAERSALASTLSGYREHAVPPSPVQELSPIDEAKLRALGYVE